MTPLRSVLVRWLVAVLARTWRVEVVGAHHLSELRRRRTAFLFALWHRSVVPLCWFHRGQGIALLVSGHRDGALLAGATRAWHYDVIRGSSTWGGARGLRQVVRALRRGREVAITPDGPVGPARAAKPGAVRAARLAGVPILPVAADAAHAWVLRTWDGLVIPKPFSPVRVVYGAPWYPGRNPADADTLASAIDGACRRAAEIAA